MRLRSTLIGATFLALPLAAHAQMAASPMLGYPISGFYVGAAGGLGLKGKESVKNISSNLALGTGVSTPNLNLNTSMGGAFVGTVGVGLGNGFRLEAEVDYRGNGFKSATGFSPTFGTAVSVRGSEQLTGVMVNLDYDFIGLTPWFVPYVGIGVGYQWARLDSFSVLGTGTAAARTPLLTSDDTEGSPAAQGIVGAAIPLSSFAPGLSLTAEYRILGLLSTRTYNAALTVTTPAGARVTRTGSFQLGREYNHTFLFGIRYIIGVAPPAPPPAPAPVAAPAPAPARSYLVFFDWDSAALTPRAREIVREAAEAATRVQYTRIEVNGYTDTSGTPRYNLKLSVRRARNVAAELVRDGVPASAITIRGFGETHLLVPTGPGVREPQNRRVEIIIR